MYKGMKKIIIGIDVSKEKIDVSHQDMDRQTVPAYLGKYENSPKGYKAMVKDLSRMHKGICPGQWLFCCETTGTYDRPMCYWLCANGFNVWRESALQIRWSLGIRRGKDDKADSMAIAEYAWRHMDKACLFHIPEEKLAALKDLFVYRMQLVDRCKAQKARLKSLDAQGKAASAAAALIKHDIKKEIEAIEKSIAKFENEIMTVINSSPDLKNSYKRITSINGVGMVTAVSMIAFSDNFTNIPTPNKMATYCGVAAFRKKSGDSIDKRQDVSNLSNRRLKGILSMAARSAIHYNPDIKSYFERLVANGKPYGIAVNNVKNKLIHIMYALIKNASEYKPGYQHERKSA